MSIIDILKLFLDKFVFLASPTKKYSFFFFFCTVYESISHHEMAPIKLLPTPTLLSMQLAAGGHSRRGEEDRGVQAREPGHVQLGDPG